MPEVIERPPDFDEFIWGRETWPFFVAVVSGDEATVRSMLASSPWLARAEYAYLQCLHYAVGIGRPAMVRLLLEAGANPVAEGWSGRFGPERRDDSPLARARDRELDEIVPQLDGAAKKPLRDLPDQPRPSPTPERQREDEMMRLAHRGNLQGAVGLLRDHPELAQAGLYEAVHQDHPALVRMLVERGAEPARPWRWSCWYTGPMHSLRYRRPRYETAEFLIEHGVTPDHTNGMGMTTLHILAAEGTVEAAGWLLDRGADLHPRDGQFDSTPLAWAARRGHGAIVERLRGVS